MCLNNSKDGKKLKSIAKKWTSTSLVLKIVVGLVIGALIGIFAPGATAVGILGTVFVGALKAIAPILVAFLVMSALAKSKSGLGSRFRTVIILYMLSTFLAAIVAVIASYLFPLTLVLSGTAEGTPPSGIGDVFTNLLTSMVSNPIDAVASGNYLGVLFWAVVVGLVMKKTASENTINVIADLSDVITKVVGGIIQFAPIGILGLIYSAVSESGVGIFTTYGKLLAVLVGSMLVVAFIVDPIVSSIFLKGNAYPLVLKCLRESGVTAFFTRSSAANIPVNMELCDRLGLDKDFYSVSIPLGATINMDGAAVTITVMTLATALTMGITVDIPTAIVLSILATLGACGSSGVAGGSLLLIPMACSLFGISSDISMQVVAVGFIIGVIQDSLETALNSSGDVIFTATAEFHDRMKRGEKVDISLKNVKKKGSN